MNLGYTLNAFGGGENTIQENTQKGAQMGRIIANKIGNNKAMSKEKQNVSFVGNINKIY